MSEDLDDILDEVGEVDLDEATLGDVATLCNRARDLGLEAKELEDKLTALKQAREQLLTVDIPEAMLQVGLTELRLDSGHRVTIRPFFSGRINHDKAAEAYSYLMEHAPDILKTELDLIFSRGDLDEMRKVADRLKEEGYNVKEVVGVHTQTLTKYIKDSYNEDPDFKLPAELFDVFIGQKAYIK